MTYCDFVKTEGKGSLHRKYHDTAYGFPIDDENELFGRLILEINQAGLSWDLILKKEVGFREAYDNFNVKKISRYSDKEVSRLLANPNIIRNHLKIEAAIFNAKVISKIQLEHGSFKTWLDSHRGIPKEDWVKLFKKTFKFTGGEIVGEFLMSTGYLSGAHAKDCPIYKKLSRQKNT